MRVTVGEYTVVMEGGGRLHALRHGDSQRTLLLQFRLVE